jgi:hypothetical protein
MGWFPPTPHLHEKFRGAYLKPLKRQEGINLEFGPNHQEDQPFVHSLRDICFFRIHHSGSLLINSERERGRETNTEREREEERQTQRERGRCRAR